MPMWNVWHGCHKISPGCRHCYVFREDAAFGAPVSTEQVRRTSMFNLPLRRDRKRNYKYQSGPEFALCMTSDFLLPDADEWRPEVWDIIRTRNDCRFFFFTKRIERLAECLPSDWNCGYKHVAVGCTVENQVMADLRLPIFLELPIKHRLIIVAPMLEKIDMRSYLIPELIESVSVGGESGKYARPLDYEWVLDVRKQCVERGVPFNFHQTGSYFIKDGKTYRIPRQLQHSQAKKAGLDTISYSKIIR